MWITQNNTTKMSVSDSQFGALSIKPSLFHSSLRLLNHSMSNPFYFCLKWYIPDTDLSFLQLYMFLNGYVEK